MHWDVTCRRTNILVMLSGMNIGIIAMMQILEQNYSVDVKRVARNEHINRKLRWWYDCIVYSEITCFERRPFKLKRPTEAKLRPSVIPYTFQQSHYLGYCMDKTLRPEVIFRVSKEFNECEDGPPRMRPVHNKSFKENFRGNFLEHVRLGLRKKE